jgi:GDP-L-fucose synthase
MVGRTFVRHPGLSGNHHLVVPTRLQVDLRDRQAVRSFVRNAEPDIVVHLAALVGGIQANIDSPVEYLTENVDMAQNVILACLAESVPRLLFVASSCMYPVSATNPLREESLLEGPLEPTNEGYALAKLVGSRLCEYASRANPVEYKTLIPTNMYGPFDCFDGHRSHLVAAAINKVHRAKIKGDASVEIWGDGTARREFMYVEDFAEFLAYALENFDRLPQYLNVGTGVDYTVGQYYQAVAQVVGYDGSFYYNSDRPVGIKQKLLSTRRLRSLGWNARTQLEEGLKRTYDFYLGERETVKHV